MKPASHTVHREIAQRRACRALDFNVRALKKEEDWFEGVPIDFPDI